MALVGAPHDSTLASLGGAVYVFTFDGTAWTQPAQLFASDTEQNTIFGASIALSGDTALIGSGAEAFYVFTFDGTSWSEQAKLTASDGADADAKAGRLDFLWQEPLEDVKAGRVKPLDGRRS